MDTHSNDLRSPPVLKPVIDKEMHRRAKWRNRINTWMIMGGLTMLLVISAWVLFGASGIVWALGLGGMLALLTPRFSPAMVLRFYKARAIQPPEAPEIFRIMRVLAQRAELPEVPKLYYVASSNVNAFAVGRPDDSAITVTDGLLRGLNLRQLTGVLAHEVSHIANEDIKVMGLADVVSRLTGVMQSTGFLLLFLGIWRGGGAIIAAIVLMLAPTIGTFLQLALSRSREYDADLAAAQLSGDPVGLASALETMQRRQGSLWESIVLPGGRMPDPSLLRTHPKTEDRIARLLDLKANPEPEVETGETRVRLPAAFRPVLQRPRFHASGLWY
jgi:heat shock protein HtpX